MTDTQAVEGDDRLKQSLMGHAEAKWNHNGPEIPCLADHIRKWQKHEQAKEPGHSQKGCERL